MQLDEAVQTFLAESHDLLTDMERELLRLEHEVADTEQINTIFRAAHTIKGSAGIFGFDPIVAFTHHVESLIDKMRAGTLQIDADGIALLLACVDHITAMLEPVAADQPLDAASNAQGQTLIQRLIAYSGGDAAPAQAVAPVAAPSTPTSSPATSGANVASTDAWHISLRFGAEVLRNGMDPLSFLRYLTTMGDLIHLTTLADAMPDAEAMDPEACYLGFEITFQSLADKATIESAFEFVRDDCALRILPPHSKVTEYVNLIAELPENKIRLGDILLGSGALTPTELAWGLQVQAEEDHHAGLPPGEETHTRPLGEILVQEGKVTPPVVHAALEKQQQIKEHKAQENRFIRVEAEKLDQLITLVGELVIAGAATHLMAQQTQQTEVLEATSTLSRLIEEVRNSAMSLRMVQIGGTFQRFERVVRDVSRDLGKDIALVVNGGETELDKSMVEKLGDPLMHLVRNALDHGIEMPDVRQANDKTAQATVQLNAYHDSGSIVIEVVDDGAGLHRDKIRQKAIDRGLMTPEQEISDQDIYKMIFEPGFSTATQVSNLSGRGVGMDVVRRNIEALRGTIELDSQLGKGTTIRIRLPLTLAIIDGFLVGIGQARYIIPLDMVRECLELTEQDRRLALERGYTNLRGGVLPLLRLKEVFTLEGKNARRENIVVVQCGKLRAGLVVDTLMGEFQTVIKPLGTFFGILKGVSGFTILGSGEVALILDVPGILQHVVNAQAGQRAAA